MPCLGRRTLVRALETDAEPERAPQSAPEAPFDDLEPLAAQWQRALDAADRALVAAADTLPAPYLRSHRSELAEERRQTAKLLITVARAKGIHRVPWLSPVPMSNRLLGLDGAVEACLFDLDGVLTDSGLLHAAAWGTVIDDLLLRLSGQLGWRFVPFNRDADYLTYFDGRSRSEGVHGFLASRGIRIPRGAVTILRTPTQRVGSQSGRARRSRGPSPRGSPPSQESGAISRLPAGPAYGRVSFRRAPTRFLCSVWQDSRRWSGPGWTRT